MAGDGGKPILKLAVAAPAAMAVAMLCGCSDGSGEIHLRNSTGNFVLTAAHRLDPATGLRGPNILHDPLLPGNTASIPHREGAVLAYDEAGDCYRPEPPEAPGDTLAVTLESLTAGNIHAGGGSVPVRLVNGLDVRVRRVAHRSEALRTQDFLGSATLWPAETLTVWSDSGRVAFWVKDQAGAVLAPPPISLENSPASLVVDSNDIFRGDSAVAAGAGPARLRVVNLLPGVELSALRLRALLDSAGPQPSSEAVIELSAPLDTMEAAVFSAARGRYFLETVLSDSTVMRTHPFTLRRDTSRIFLRPGLLEFP